MLLQGKEREIAIQNMVAAAVKDFNITKEQAAKRVNALVAAIDKGMFAGIGESGPANEMEALFVRVKTEQYMTTHIED